MGRQHSVDISYMQQALQLARKAACLGEVPVGALIVYSGAVIGASHNTPIAHHDATAHAEIQAIRAACRHLSNYRLPKTTLYVTLEPCTMCAGAIFQARIDRLVFGASDPKTGVAGSVMNIFDSTLNHHTKIITQCMAEESTKLLQDFFRARRHPTC